MNWNDAIQCALADRDYLMHMGCWASVESSLPEKYVRLRSGPIHANGMREQAIITYSYEPKPDRIQVTTHTHN